MNTLHRYTERENEIATAAIVYASEICKDRVLGEYNLSDQEMIGLAFSNGAMLADANPRRGLVKLEDVRVIYGMWLENGTCNFIEYFYDYCEKEGWL